MLWPARHRLTNPLSLLSRNNLHNLVDALHGQGVRCLALVLLLFAHPVRAAEDDDAFLDEEQPGLNAVYTSEAGSIERPDADLSFVWSAGTPDPRLPAGPFQANWTGRLLLKEAGTYRFHAFLKGRATVRLGDQELLAADRETVGWVSGPSTPLSFGMRDLEISYESTGGPAEFHLYWSADLFPLEPLPVHHLLRDPSEMELDVARGRQQWDAFRCAACHNDGTTPLPSRSLQAVGLGTNPDWLRSHLTRTAETVGDSRMPVFGLSASDADDLLAWLREQNKSAKPPKLRDWKPAKDVAKSRANGLLLIQTLGCLACHQHGEVGETGPYAGGSLNEIGSRRSADWLLSWMLDPASLDPLHRMPQMTLSKAEVIDVVAALTGDTPEASWKPGAGGDSGRGAQLAERFRCTACHRVGDAEKSAKTSIPLDRTQLTSESGCLAPSADAKTGRPGFPQVNAAAIAAYLKTWMTDRLVQTPEFHGAQLLERKGCADCHDRDGERGISRYAATIAKVQPELQGLTQQLIPPALTAVGDRMLDGALKTALAGAPEQPRMNWLRVRMPKYKHSPDDEAALVRLLQGHDQIPAEAPDTPKYPIDSSDPQVKLAGRELLGGTGFSCIACHALKEYQPQKVALGTRGSDLFLLGARMRPEYYFRWTRSPLRVMPGVEMPSYQRPHPTFLNGELARQLAAIWDALHDPNLPPPTNPAVVEQFVSVAPGQPPRVVRDVFSAPKGISVSTIPHAFAAGFGNGLSLLFDLEHPGVRAWTIGDFARQRTAGKSWFWDMAGVPAMIAPEATSEFVLDVHRANQSPQRLEVANGQLISYQITADAVELTYRLNTEEEETSATIHEVWTDEARNGQVVRRVSVIDASSGVTVLFRWFFGETLKPKLPTARIQVDAVALGADGLYGFPADANKPLTITYAIDLAPQRAPLMRPEFDPVPQNAVTQVPGFEGVRFPLSPKIMPTAMTWNARGELLFTSLQGTIFRVRDTNQDGVGDLAEPLETGLAAPFGIAVDGDDLLIAHKPEVLRLVGAAGSNTVQKREVFASGWGYTEDYHDWTCGIVRDRAGSYYISLGSDYAHKNRPKSQSRWRGRVLRIEPNGQIESIASGLRYATGLAIDEHDNVFTTDQQGVQNCFNELNVIRPGRAYGVPAQLDEKTDEAAESAAVEIPHPWTRSVNGICYVPRDRDWPLSRDFGGQIIGAEYDTRFLIRLSLQSVDGVLQGAAYPLCPPGQPSLTEHLTGPLSVAISPDGDLYIGNIYDSGWQGGLNTGDITRLRRKGDLPNGIREVRATPEGFEIEFLKPIDRQRGGDASNYQLAGYTRVWQGSYATPDSGRHTPTITTAAVNATGTLVRLTVDALKPGHVYELTCGEIAETALYPATAAYTLKKVPGRE